MARTTRPEAVRLESLRPLPLKEQVLRQLNRLIDEGTLRPGDRLPSERELAEQLEVSRGTVRESVQFLHALGVIEIRHGSGTFVRHASTDRQALRDEWRRWTVRHSDTVRDLLEVRMGLESFAAELAVRRMGAEGPEKMAAALERMEDAVEAHDVPALVRSDVAFHEALCAAAGNRALAELAAGLGDRLVQERATTWSLPGRPERSLAQHRRIYEAVSLRDAARARRSVLVHLASVLNDVEQLLGHQGGQRPDEPRRPRRKEPR